MEWKFFEFRARTCFRLRIFNYSIIYEYKHCNCPAATYGDIFQNEKTTERVVTSLAWQMKCLKCLCPGAHRPGEPCEALWWRCPTTLEKMLECRVQVSFYEMDTTAYGTVRAQYGHNMGSVWARSRYGNSMGNASTCFDGIDRQDGNFVALSLDSWVPGFPDCRI